MGFLTGMLSAVSSVVSALSNVLMPTLSQVLDPLIARLARALTAFFRELGLIEPDEDMEQLGDKAIQAAMDEDNPIRPENYDLYRDYVDAVKKYQEDPDLSARIPRTEKDRKGIELESGLAIEKYGQPMLDILVLAAREPDRFADPWLINFGKAIREDESTLQAVANYLNRKNQSIGEDDKAFATLERIEKTLLPDATDTIIIDSVKERFAN